MSSKKHGFNLLSKLRNFRASPEEATSSAIHSFLQSLDCPRALSVWILFSNQEHDQLANLEFDPLDYAELQSLKSAYLATCFLSKFKGLSLSFDPKAVAIEKFQEFELLCKQTNNRFRNLSKDQLYFGPNVHLHHAVVRKIDRLLGDYHPEELVSKADWGPGASTLIKRRDASSSIKFQHETGITRDLYALLPTDLLEVCYPHWAQHLKTIDFPCFQVGNRVITVPKNAKTDRVIAIEPGINLFFQKSIGDMIGVRLLRAGIDLRSQKNNQLLAKVGSRDLHLATVDMSSASDSISESVVESLLPPRWYSLLDSCRSRYGSLNGQAFRWNKFSSMGNGFTFQLESLIFFAAAEACVEYLYPNYVRSSDVVSVYGDDVIIPTSAFKLFSELMTFYGFRVNAKKSHFSSCFRESCGEHYFSGFDVKPIYLKDRLTSIQTVFRLANSVRRLAKRSNLFFGCDARFRSVFYHLVNLVPRSCRLWIPDSLGDGGFIGNFDESTPSRCKHGIEGYRCLHLVDVALSYEEVRIGYFLSSLWRLSKYSAGKPSRRSPSIDETIAELTSRSLSVSERNSVPRHRTRSKLVKSIVRQWSDLGPWI